MKKRGRRLTIGLWGVLIALFGWTTRANAGYVINPSAAALVSQFSAFLGDFNTWNASHEDLPLLALEMTPNPEKADMIVLLWWLWLQDQRGAHASGGGVAFPQNPFHSGDPFSHPSLSNELGGPLPAVLPGNGGFLQAGLGNELGAVSLGNGSTVPLSTPPIGIILSGRNVDNPSQGPGDDVSFEGPVVQSADPPSSDLVSAPEPSAFALFCCGALSLLTYGCIRWRAARWGTSACAASSSSPR